MSKIEDRIWQQLRRSSIRRVIALLTCYFIVLIWACADVRSSVFYQFFGYGDYNRFITNHAAREAWAEEYLASVRDIPPSLLTKEGHDLCMVIPTAVRKKTFLPHIVALALNATHESSHSVHLNVYYGEDSFLGRMYGGEQSKEQREDILQILQQAPEVPVTSAIRQLAHSSQYNNVHKRESYHAENFDYAAALTMCLQNSDAPFITVIEDDVVITSNFVDRILNAVKQANLFQTKWLFLKLFRTGTYDGFSFDVPISLLELVVTGLGLACITHGVIAIVFREKNNYRFFLLWIVVSIVSLYLVGRQSTTFPILYQREGVTITEKTMGTQAHVYPREHVQGLIDFLRRSTLPTDNAVDTYKQAMGFEGMLLRPNLVNHVGLSSSIQSKTTKRDKFRLEDHFLYLNVLKRSEWYPDFDDGDMLVRLLGKHIAYLALLLVALPTIGIVVARDYIRHGPSDSVRTEWKKGAD